jgi:hypothetical protein
MMNRESWRDFKRKHGVPDGVVRGVGIGNRCQSYFDNIRQRAEAHDYQECVTLEDALIREMKSWANALKTTDPAKFKGSTPFQKINNYKQAHEAFTREIDKVLEERRTHDRLARPMQAAQQSTRAALDRLRALNERSPREALREFYSTYFRAIGADLSLAARATNDADLKAVAAEHKRHGNHLDALVKGDFDTKEFYVFALTALTGLAKEIEGN